MTRVFGIYGGHDQCVAVAENGRIVAAMEEERPTRIKHTHPPPSHCPAMGLMWLEEIGYPLVSADVIALAEPLCSSGPRREALRTMGLPPWTEHRMVLVEHHTAHVGLAYAWSGWDECYAFAVDGGGSMSFSLAAHCKDGEIIDLARDNMANVQSIMNAGLWYLLITIALGFKPIRDEGKITGMAARGDKNRFKDLFRSKYIVNPFHVTDKNKPGATRQDGTYAPTRENLHAEIGIDPCDDSVRADLAAAAQDFFEYMVMTSVESCIPPGKRLVLSGGCAANVTLNRKLLDYAGELFIAPPMNDGGLAAGAAIMASGKIRSEAIRNVYLGYDAGAIPSNVSPRDIARKVADGAFVGLCHGRCELGPRALGNRSIVGDPTRADTPARLNAKLKRSGFMPFAPVILHEDADAILEPDWHRAELSAEHMTMAFKVKPEWHSRIPAVVHIDGTCRPQVLKPGVNPFYEEVIREFKKITGVGVLLNTSLNMHESPIVYDEGDAVKVLEAGGIDHLVSAGGLR